MASSVPQPSRINVVSRVSASKPISRRITSPITPATTTGVTGLVFPSPLESSPSEPLPTARHRPLRRMSRIDSSSSISKSNFVEISSNSSDPPQVDDTAALDDLWNSLRAKKELKMDKERPKVKSLEEYKPTAILNNVPKSPSPRPASRLMISDSPKPVPESPATSAPSARTRERRSLLEDVLSNGRSSNERDSFFRTPSPIPPKTPSPAKTSSFRRKKSITLFMNPPDKNYSIAIFDLRGVDKEDIRVTFRRDHIIVSWEKWEVENWEEEDCIARRTVERVYHRVIPLAEGTKFRDIYCTMKGEDLLLRYPLVVMNGTGTVES